MALFSTLRLSTRRAFSTANHAVISTFDLFSIGVGPSSSHTVGPMRAANIFITDLKDLDLLHKVQTVKINLYGSLAATGAHHTPQAILLGLEGSDPETIDTGTIPARYQGILQNKTLFLAGHHRISYDMDRDMLWRWDQVLKTHPNGMRFSAFDHNGDLVATNEYFSVGGGFVVNEKTKVDENLFYKGVDKKKVHGARLHQTHLIAEPDTPVPDSDVADFNVAGTETVEIEDGQPPYPFDSGNSLLALTKKHNMTIAQIVHDNEKHFGYTDEDIQNKIMRIWQVMDECIRTGVSTSETTLPGRLGLRRRAPMLYRRLMRGFYPGVSAPMNENPKIAGGDAWAKVKAGAEAIGGPAAEKHAQEEADKEMARIRAAVGVEDSELGLGNGNGKSYGANMGGGGFKGAREVKSQRATAPPRVTGSFDHAILPMPPRRTVIPAMDFLSCYAIAVNEVNASGGRIVTSPTNGAAGVIPAVLKYIVEAIGMLFKRGSTISAAEGGCQAEVGVACSMASAGFAACMGAFVGCASPETVLQERNSLGAVKAVTAAQLSMASDGVYSVTLDEAIEAMRVTAADMSVKYKETSLSGLALNGEQLRLR
ncbi:L-serine dehydratase [Psilocybe cubensis]|uniref:L-serine dehydratase n=1 Tax=Psilocybe cubensis TaxID=181762 RepID=A0ACB8GVG3_PSICU|nr:L-serine dehydratase [Psilocybe cubensis]KAH9479618.1 L-serine dehydratase [Psilocybe cubensis]